jgi:Zn-dependent protease with chaperone function
MKKNILFKEFFRRKMQWVAPAFFLVATVLLQLVFLLTGKQPLTRQILSLVVLILLLAALAFAWRYERRMDGKLYRILPRSEKDPEPERSGKKLKRIILITLVINMILFFLH